MPVKNRLAELHHEITEWRRDLHEHPEILFETHRTAAVVAEKLESFGCDEIVTGIGRALCSQGDLLFVFDDSGQELFVVYIVFRSFSCHEMF